MANLSDINTEKIEVFYDLIVTIGSMFDKYDDKYTGDYSPMFQQVLDGNMSKDNIFHLVGKDDLNGPFKLVAKLYLHHIKLYKDVNGDLANLLFQKPIATQIKFIILTSVSLGSIDNSIENFLAR